MATRANIWTEIVHHPGTDMRSPAWEIRLMRQVGDGPVEQVDSGTTYTDGAAQALGSAMLTGAQRDEAERLAAIRSADHVDGYDRDDLGLSEDR